MNNQSFKVQLGDKEIAFELANWAEQANGNVLVQIGDTVALVTCVMSKGEIPNQGFFPLTVDYEEKFYAAGKILGSRFVRREGRPSDEATITARLIDRAIRPLFPKELKNEVQVIVTCLSWDAKQDPDIPGLAAASLALSLSDIPWKGPLGVVRVGRVQGTFVLNPTYEERTQSDLDFVLAGVKEGKDVLFNMIEAESDEVPEQIYEEALQYAKPFLLNLIEFQEKLIKESGQEKVAFSQAALEYKELEQEMAKWLGERLEQALFQGGKQNRMEAVNDLKIEMTAFVQEKHQDSKKTNYARDFFETELDRIVHKAAVEHEQRVDAR